jgi:hypothetical protein
MNNNNRDYPARSGIELNEMLLEDWHAPDREALVEATPTAVDGAKRPPTMVSSLRKTSPNER